MPRSLHAPPSSDGDPTAKHFSPYREQQGCGSSLPCSSPPWQWLGELRYNKLKELSEQFTVKFSPFDVFLLLTGLESSIKPLHTAVPTFLIFAVQP